MTERKGPQNSPLRKMFSPLTTWGASTLIKAFPNITADQVTNFGLGAAIIGSGLKAIEKVSGGDNSLAAFGLLMIALIFDGLDGPISRLQKTSSANGAIRDVLVDRTQESAMALSRIVTASLRKDPIGVTAAFLAGISGPIPSLLRAKVEALDSVVPEAGKNPLSILGMRLPRAGLAVISTSFPETPTPLLNYPIQPVLDATSFISNSSAIIERVSILKNVKKNQSLKDSNSELQLLGNKKAELLAKFNWINAVTMTAGLIVGLANALQ